MRNAGWKPALPGPPAPAGCVEGRERTLLLIEPQDLSPPGARRAHGTVLARFVGGDCVSKSRLRTVKRLLARGGRFHQEGRTERADVCFREALQADPRCVEALRARSVIALECRRYAESIEFIRAALAVNPDDPTTLTFLAGAFEVQGEIEQALPYYQRVVEICPQSVQAHLKRGEVLESADELEAAAESYRRALELQPGSPDTCCKLANVLRKQGSHAEARRLCEQALSLDPVRSDTYTDLGVVLTDMQDYGAAANAFARALELKPDSARAAHLMAYYYQRCGDIRAAADSLQRAVKLDPDLYLAHLSLGSILSMTGDHAGALKAYERARALCPNSAEAGFYLGLWHLGQGDLAGGWPGYELREEARRLRKKFSEPQWKGEPLEGSRIFLHAEQGHGDTLQVVRYVPLVAARGGEVVLAVPPRLHRLLERTEGASRVISDGGVVTDFRWHCPLMSLPLAFATELSTIPAKIPYVHADPVLAEAWRERLPVLAGAAILPPVPAEQPSLPLLSAPLRIGLAWDGDPKYCQNFRRRIPLDEVAPLTQVAGTTFYSLQMGPSAAQVKQLGSQSRLIDLQDEQKDFADTAAIVANLDLVISIDTSVAHLAGAMGKPLWVLLNNSPDWRWLLEREDSPWYPTARLFRQSTMGNWPEVMSRVEAALRELVARTAVEPQDASRPG
jgi:tetratricopeptide (TPR) repeat protein